MRGNIRLGFSDSFHCTELEVFDTPTVEELKEVENSEFESIVIVHGDVSGLKETLRIRDSHKYFIYASDVKQDISWVSDLRKLKYLALNGNFKGNIEFDNYESLEDIYVNINKSTESLFSSSISPRSLGLYKFKDSLTAIPSTVSQNVTKLLLSGCGLVSMEGLSKFKKLEYLQIDRCLKLSDISELSVLPEIKDLCISGSNKISDYSALSGLTSLEEFSFMNKSLPSLKLLNSDKLKFVELGDSTKVEDMDIEALLEIPSMRRAIFSKRKGYSMGAVEMNEILDKR